MNNRFDPPDERVLINSALSDETWCAFDARLRDEALGRFESAKRRRRVGKLVMRFGALLILATAAVFITIRPTAPSVVKSVWSASQPALPAAPESVISEQQMLDMFPPGSCLLAEIDGKKQLVFLDQKIAKEGFPIASSH
jgi:hypothetical protein